MTVRNYDFFCERNTSSLVAQTLVLERNPYNEDGITAAALFSEFMVCYSGTATTSTLGMSKWIAAWRFSSAGTLGTVALGTDRKIQMIDSFGTVPTVTVDVTGNAPVISWTPHISSSLYWVIKGSIWTRGS
jgi:hypothetical protein